MRLLSLLVILLTVLTGCHYESRLFINGQEITENPSEIETDRKISLKMRAYRKDKNKAVKFSEAKIEISYYESSTPPEPIEANNKSIDGKSGLNIGKDGEILAVIPFPVGDSKSAVVKISGKCKRKWLERTIIVTLPPPEPTLPLSARIVAEGARNGILVVTSGSSVTLQAEVTGGTPPYQYLWQDPLERVAGRNETLLIESFTCREVGLYTLIVNDSDGNYVVAQ